MPTAGYAVLRSREEALARAGARIVPGGAQGRRAGRGQGRDHLPRRAAAREAVDVFFVEQPLRGHRGGAGGVPGGRGAVAAGGVRRRAGGADGARPRTTSGSSTATEGPNTGGMGSYSPVPGIDREHADALALAVHQPIVDEMRRRGTPFHGVLYAGLMMTADGPKVLEYNCRFGDPETQAVLPRLRSDVLELLEAVDAHRAGWRACEIEWSDEWAVTVVLASRGYPETSSKGDEIRGLRSIDSIEVEVLHAGTAERDGKVVTDGGRVLNVTGIGATPGRGARARLRCGAADRSSTASRCVPTSPPRAVDEGRGMSEPSPSRRPRPRSMSRVRRPRRATPPLVGIVMGSKTDKDTMAKAAARARGARHPARDARDERAPRPRRGGRLRQERPHARAEGDHRRRRPGRRAARAWWPRTPTCR